LDFLFAFFELELDIDSVGAAVFDALAVVEAVVFISFDTPIKLSLSSSSSSSVPRSCSFFAFSLLATESTEVS
jgi:hypothetical protein